MFVNLMDYRKRKIQRSINKPGIKLLVFLDDSYVELGPIIDTSERDYYEGYTFDEHGCFQNVAFFKRGGGQELCIEDIEETGDFTIRPTDYNKRWHRQTFLQDMEEAQPDFTESWWQSLTEMQRTYLILGGILVSLALIAALYYFLT